LRIIWSRTAPVLCVVSRTTDLSLSRFPRTHCSFGGCAPPIPRPPRRRWSGVAVSSVTAPDVAWPRGIDYPPNATRPIFFAQFFQLIPTTTPKKPSKMILLPTGETGPEAAPRPAKPVIDPVRSTPQCR